MDVLDIDDYPSSDELEKESAANAASTSKKGLRF